MSLGVVRAGCGHSRKAKMVADSQLAMSEQFALQLQQLLNARPGDPRDLHRTSNCFKNTLFFRK